MRKPLAYNIHRHLLQARGKSENNFVEGAASSKEYPRMSRIVLPRNDIKMSLSDALNKRYSCRDFDSAPLTKEIVGALLGNAIGIPAASSAHQAGAKASSRPYPSGGALYPIETYVIAQHVEHIPRGAYHYHAPSHALENLWEVPSPLNIFLAQAEWANNAHVIILLTGVWERNYAKYNDFGYLLGVLEAGHMAQNVLLAASALHISACPLGGFNDGAVSDILDLDEKEQPVYAIAIGTKT